MKVGIIGGGAIGLLFGAYLAPIHQVTVYTKSESQANNLKARGIVLERNGICTTHNICASPLPSLIDDVDILIIALKQYHLSNVLKITNIENIHTILFIQNGMGHISMMQSLTNENIVVGIVEHGALKLNDHYVIHTGIGNTKISAITGDESTIINMLDAVQLKYFPYTIEKHWFEVMITKLVVNAVINPLTSLYNVKNGKLIQNSFFYETMRALFDEIVLVLPVKNKTKMWEYVQMVCVTTANNLSSMLKDIQGGRQTEVEAILGYIINEANLQNKQVPTTTFVYYAIKGLEKKGGE